MSATAKQVVLRDGVVIPDPLDVVLSLLEAWKLDVDDRPGSSSFGETELRQANRDGARISAAEIAAILERRRRIERALRAIAPEASLTAPNDDVPWTALAQLFGAFTGIKGVGFSKMTKALYRKRPAVFPILDSIVQRYLAEDDPGTDAAFGVRALALVRGYKRDLDNNRAALGTIRRELAGRGARLTAVRILDLLILAVAS
jgi:hypothetical protein